MMLHKQFFRDENEAAADEQKKSNAVKSNKLQLNERFLDGEVQQALSDLRFHCKTSLPSTESV